MVNVLFSGNIMVEKLLYYLFVIKLCRQLFSRYQNVCKAINLFGMYLMLFFVSAMASLLLNVVLKEIATYK